MGNSKKGWKNTSLLSFSEISRYAWIIPVMKILNCNVVAREIMNLVEYFFDREMKWTKNVFHWVFVVLYYEYGFKKFRGVSSTFIDSTNPLPSTCSIWDMLDLATISQVFLFSKPSISFWVAPLKKQDLGSRDYYFGDVDHVVEASLEDLKRGNSCWRSR